MIIECPNCNKKFNLDQKLIPQNGRTLKCSSCSHIWHHKVTVKIDNNKNRDISASGNGPISAFVTAMRERFNLIFRLSDFSQNTRSSGSTAEAAAYVEIRVPDENGKSVFGVGIDTSITLAPIKAVISAINRI